VFLSKASPQPTPRPSSAPSSSQHSGTQSHKFNLEDQKNRDRRRVFLSLSSLKKRRICAFQENLHAPYLGYQEPAAFVRLFRKRLPGLRPSLQVFQDRQNPAGIQIRRLGAGSAIHMTTAEFNKRKMIGEKMLLKEVQETFEGFWRSWPRITPTSNTPKGKILKLS